MSSGRLRRRLDGRWEEIAPASCPAGHPFGPGRALVGWRSCTAVGGGHRTHECRACGAVTYDPPVDQACDHTAFDGRRVGERGAK